MKFGLMGVFNFGCFVMGLLQIFKEKRKVCKKQLKMLPREMTWVLQRCSLFSLLKPFCSEPKVFAYSFPILCIVFPYWFQ